MTKNQIIAEKDGSLTINVNAGEVTVNKDLTDEEIENIYWSLESTGYDGTFSFIDFARAILKKAQEK